MKQLGESAIKFLIAFHAYEIQKEQSIGQALSIYDFVKNIKWPAAPATYTVGVIGNNSTYFELDKNLKTKLIEDKTFTVKQIQSYSDVMDCQVVYLASERSQELTSVMEETTDKNILVVTESDLVDEGAGISFLMVDDDLRFKVNTKSLSKSGLEVNATLLSRSLQ